VEEKEKKKRTLEYFQQLWDKVLEEDTILLKDAEGSQIMGSKCKEASLEDNVDRQPSKKAKEKQPVRYYGDNGVKMGSANPFDQCVHAGQNCLVHNSR